MSLRALVYIDVLLMLWTGVIMLRAAFPSNTLNLLNPIGQRRVASTRSELLLLTRNAPDIHANWFVIKQRQTN